VYKRQLQCFAGVSQKVVDEFNVVVNQLVAAGFPSLLEGARVLFHLRKRC
jgi:hypothetical protein